MKREQAASEFGPNGEEAIASRFGNLMLIEQAINRLPGNKAYSKGKRSTGNRNFFLSDYWLMPAEGHRTRVRHSAMLRRIALLPLPAN
jgi:hypothetical protein